MKTWDVWVNKSNGVNVQITAIRETIIYFSPVDQESVKHRAYKYTNALYKDQFVKFYRPLTKLEQTLK